MERNDAKQGSQSASAPEQSGYEVHSHLAPDRFLAYFFDDLHLEPGDLTSARNAAISRLEFLQPSERWAVYTTSGVVQLDFTADRAKLEDALRRINSKAEARRSDCPYIPYYQADLIINQHNSDAFQAAVRDYIACYQIPSDTSAQAAAAIASARPMVQSLATQVLDKGESQTNLAFRTFNDVLHKMAIMPGERTILLVSPGFLVTTDKKIQTDLIQRAINAKITIGSLDARGLYARDPAGDIGGAKKSAASLPYDNQLALESASSESQVLSELAYGTGGRFMHNTNDLAGSLAALSAQPEVSYLLAFAPQKLKNDGSFHTLKVELKQGLGLNIQARNGYYAPKPKDSAEDDAKQEIADAVFAQSEIHELPLRVQTQFFRSGDDAAHIYVLVHVDVRQMQFHKSEGRNLNQLTVIAALFDRNANFISAKSNTVKMHIKDDTLSTKLNSGITVKSNFDIAPGSYLVRVVARDEQGKMTTQNDVVEIP